MTVRSAVRSTSMLVATLVLAAGLLPVSAHGATDPPAPLPKARQVQQPGAVPTDGDDPAADLAVERAQAAAEPAPGGDRGQCGGQRYGSTDADAALAAKIMSGVVPIPRYPDWTGPADGDLTWRENPFANVNWVAELNGLRWLDPLRREWLRTGDPALRERYVALWQQWLSENPPATPRTAYSWQDMVVGLRGVGLTCLDAVLGTPGAERPAWFAQGVADHAAALSDPRQYRTRGNHGLHQNLGLLALGCTFAMPVWQDTARGRAVTLLRRSVDEQGVTDEGSTLYEHLNHVWYAEMVDRLHRCDQPVDPAYDRVARMGDFLGRATQPDGTLVPFGDTSAITRVPVTPGTASEYAGSGGAVGIPPADKTSVFARGYAFSRSGWFDTESAAEQSLVSLRFGPSKSSAVHGHEDGGSLNLFGYGRQLLWQPGVYGGGGGAPRHYVISNQAHDVVDVPARSFNPWGTTRLSIQRTTPTVDLFTVRSEVLSDVAWTRSVVHLKAAHVLLVDDLVTQPTAHSVVQRWQLGPGRSVSLGGNRATTAGEGANLQVLWLRTPRRVDVVSGRSAPGMLGWVSPAVNAFVPASTLEAWGSGATVHTIAVLVPRPAGAPAAARVVSSVVSRDRTSVVLDTGHGRWRILYTRTSVSAIRVG